MDFNSYALVLLVFIFLLGVSSIIRDYFTIHKKYIFTTEYFETLKAYIQSNGQDVEKYSWLTRKSSKIQTLMGSFGLVDYKPAAQNYIYKNYQLIVNGLGELRSYYNDNYVFSRLANEMSQTLQEALIRYIGVLEEHRDFYISQLKNPIIWFREGVRVIIALPINLLSWFGIINPLAVATITTNIIFRFFSGIIAFLTFLGTIVTLVVGWNDFVSILFKFIP